MRIAKLFVGVATVLTFSGSFAQDDKTAKQAQPSPSEKLLSYERDMAPLARSYALAHVAGICQIRSDNWVNSLTMALTIYSTQEAIKRQLSVAESNAANTKWNRTYENVMHEFQINRYEIMCKRLVNSQDIVRLDDLQRKITGNYH